jgi:hypothetical protein
LPRFTFAFLTAVALLNPLLAQDSIPNTSQGFQQQYHAAFDAYRQHHEPAVQDRLDSFAIPAHWFADTFGPEQSADFARQYAEAFAEFKRRTASNFGGIDAVKARVHIDPAAPTDIQTRRWTPAESTNSLPFRVLRMPLPPVQKFEVDYVLRGQSLRLTSWIDSYIYVDGAFRYFGSANTSFWKAKP